MKSRPSWWIGLLVGSLTWGSCAPAGLPTVQAEPQSLVVFAAASLTEAFRELGEQFEAATPGVMVTFNFAGSQVLRTQIQEGAEADVFVSANHKEMDALADSGALAGADHVFVTNSLTIIVAPGNPAAIASPQDLARPGVTVVLAAEEVPVGVYSRQALSNLAEVYGASFADDVLGQVVSNEDNVKQVVAKVQLGEADAGIVYETDAATASLPTVAIPAQQNVVAEYPIAVLAQSRRASLAEAFVQYLLSSDGQAALRRWGFGPPP